MQIKYDATANAIYIKFNDNKYNKTKQPSENVAIDNDEQGEIIGIELIHLSTQISNPMEIVFNYVPPGTVVKTIRVNRKKED
jgi:uncharacterized protein YuzE